MILNDILLEITNKLKLNIALNQLNFGGRGGASGAGTKRSLGTLNESQTENLSNTNSKNSTGQTLKRSKIK